MTNRIKAPVLALTAAFSLSACGLLDVNNPNNLVEESIKLESASNGVANGSLRKVSDAISSVWEAPSVVADELYWTGSRDAWGQLDNGYIDDALNEFTDGAFPALGTGVWMAQNAVDILQTHVDNNPGDDDFAKDLARAHMFNGIILMVTGEIQEDMTFSNKMEDGQPVGPANMSQVIDRAITELDAAVTGFGALGEDDLQMTARAIRARAHMSRAIWNELNPTATNTAVTPLAFAAALADANSVLGDIGDSDWQYNLGYTSDASSCSMCSNVNNRGENQWDESLVYNHGPGASGRDSVALMDIITGEPSPAVQKALDQWGENQYGELTIVSERLLRLIVAEDALANSNTGEFEDQINAIRALDGQTGADEFTSGGAGMPSDNDMLQFTRRTNVLMMGLRLQDMYRWGIRDAKWQPGSAAYKAPGTMLPITIVECRANQYLDPSSC